jgi:anti-anti-sigma factor
VHSKLLIGHTAYETVIRVVGNGTMHESAAFQTAVKSLLKAGRGRVVFDASDCEYLDSTFLGCLISIQKCAEASQGGVFRIAASPAKRVRLFSTSSLDHYLHFVEEAPTAVDELTPLDVDRLEPGTLGRHVATCHDELAKRGGSDSEAFRSIADRLRKELGDDLTT